MDLNKIWKSELSLRARGLLGTMLYFKPAFDASEGVYFFGGNISEDALVEMSPNDGKDAIRGVLNELELEGYVKRVELRDAGKVVGKRWEISDEPMEDWKLFAAKRLQAQKGLSKSNTAKVDAILSEIKQED